MRKPMSKLSMKPILIIAEAGVNHNGDADLAYKLVDAAKESGADFVKFQTFKADNLVTQHAKQCEYQTTNSSIEESQYDMLKKLELDFDLHFQLKKYCENIGVGFLSTAFDSQSLSFLGHKLDLPFFKVPSGELTNLPFILEHAHHGKDIILSTGMSNLDEIEDALKVIAFGYLKNSKQTPNQKNFYEAYSSSEGQELLRNKVTLLHCTSEYPTPMSEVNLNAMKTMQSHFGLKVGYSDHTKGIHIPIAAAAMGASVIEKHFTLDKNMPGPDHKASLDRDELKQMVEQVRAIEIALGTSVKGPQPRELKNISSVRKSIVASKNISKGSLFTRENLALKRPGTGLSPKNYWDLIGETATQNFAAGEPIK
jgi:N-acetylneuraminate synthase